MPLSNKDLIEKIRASQKPLSEEYRKKIKEIITHSAKNKPAENLKSGDKEKRPFSEVIFAEKVKKAKKQKALLKSLSADCEKQIKHLENKIDFRLIKQNLQMLLDSNNGVGKRGDLEELKRTLSNKNGNQEFVYKLFGYVKDRESAPNYTQRYGYSHKELMKKLSPNIRTAQFEKLYALYELEKSPSMTDFRKRYDYYKNDLHYRANKKERSFFAKIGHALKKAFSAPHSIYSKGSFAFWKSRTELLEEKLNKSEVKLEQQKKKKLSKAERKGGIRLP